MALIVSKTQNPELYDELKRLNLFQPLSLTVENDKTAVAINLISGGLSRVSNNRIFLKNNAFAYLRALNEPGK